MGSIILALLGSFFFSLSNVVINRGLQGMDYLSGLVVNLFSNAIMLWIFLLLFSRDLEIWTSANLIFVGVGLLVPGLARYLLFKGMERLGAAITSCLLNSAPLFAIFLAIALLKELPTPTNLLGALSIVTGVGILSWRGESKSWRTRDLFFPLGGALLFAVRDNFVRLGLLITHSPVLGAAIAASTSALTIGGFYLATAEIPKRGEFSRRGLVYFSLSGFMNFLSYLFIYSALNLDRVSIVSPLANCSSLFIIPLAYFLLKDVDRITTRKVCAIVLVIMGVLLISWEKM